MLLALMADAAAQFGHTVRCRPSLGRDQTNLPLPSMTADRESNWGGPPARGAMRQTVQSSVAVLFGQHRQGVAGGWLALAQSTLPSPFEIRRMTQPENY